MAPNLQQRLHVAWDNISAAVLEQTSPQTHISNFLQNFGHRPSSPHPGFCLHFPFPFARLFHNRESKSRSTSYSAALVGSGNADLSMQKQELVNRKEEKDLQSFEREPSTRKTEEHVRNGHVAVKLENPMDTLIKLQLLQKQLETSVLEFSGPASKEVLGRATWTFLHTLAAQFPEKPTREQQRDVKELMAIMSRIYPCKECADHFREVLKTNPVQAGSGVDLAVWMCTVHNVVNRSLDKPPFPCQRVDARWGAVDCDEGACSLQGRMH